MHAASIWMMGVIAIGACAAASEPQLLRAPAGDAEALRDGLLALSEERLASKALVVDRQHARLTLSGSLPSTDLFEAKPMWFADAPVPPLPLLFELRPVSSTAAGERVVRGPAIQASLAVSLLRDTPVALRRIRKGSRVSCSDVGVQRREAHGTPRSPLSLPCELPDDSVALRDLAAGDAIRSIDIGPAPAVTAGALVSLNVETRGIVVVTRAVALADARVGDQIDVRLQRPTRILRTRVIGPGSVQLLEGAP